MPQHKVIFITATDTNVGKTIATFVLGVLLKRQGHTIGVMKPVQCAGGDASFLKKALETGDDLNLINPCFAPEPLSPHLAFRRAGKKVEIARIKKAFKVLKARHDVLLVEGAGGLMVPLTDHYYTADLIRDLNAEIIIVSRLGLGTINHTLLTINQAKTYGLKIKGIVFSETKKGRKTMAEQTNPSEIARLSGIKVLGTIPYLKTFTTKEVLRRCQHIAVD
jgi:dethiobiotin synthetase